MPTETSLKAYYEILDKLPKRRAQVLEQLKMYIDTNKRGPTAQELVGWSDLQGAWKRLPELAKMGAAHKCGERRCSITGATAATWALGPLVEGELF